MEGRCAERDAGLGKQSRTGEMRCGPEDPAEVRWGVGHRTGAGSGLRAERGRCRAASRGVRAGTAGEHLPREDLQGTGGDMGTGGG